MTDPFRANYPSWPWVSVGTAFNNPARAPNLPSETSDERLVQLSNIGRFQHQPLLEADIDTMDRLLSNNPTVGPDTSGNKHQSLRTMSNDFRQTWSLRENGDELDNRGFVQIDQKGNTVTAYGNTVSRGFDHILSVLESLSVGDSWDSQSYRYRRTINPIAYPHGPNIWIENIQNQPYPIRNVNGVTVGHGHPTLSTIEGFYNAYDGVIIASKFAPRSLSDGVQRPPNYEWWDVAFQQWDDLHHGNSRADVLGGRFPPTPSPSAFQNNITASLFQGTVAGRRPSQRRRPLSFYKDIPRADLAQRMKSFLNYIIWYGDFVTQEVVSVVQRCLRTRNQAQAGSGMAPVWGQQETFNAGTWPFYALLGTDAGKQLTYFLAKHKGEDVLGHKMLKSVTIFAADSAKSDPVNGVELVKWPVLLWEAVPRNENMIIMTRIAEARWPERANDGEWWLPNTPCPRPTFASANMSPRIELPLELITHRTHAEGNDVIDDTIQLPQASRGGQTAAGGPSQQGQRMESGRQRQAQPGNSANNPWYISD